MDKQKKNDSLIVYLKSPNDWKIVMERGIYRIRDIKNPPKLLASKEVNQIAFYLPSIFGKHKYTIRHTAKVKSISKAPRYECCPDEPKGWNSNKLYYKIDVEEPKLLEEPIVHYRGAHKKLSRSEMVLFPTTEAKIHTAPEFNFLFNGSDIEETMWQALLDINIYPEREWPVRTEKGNFYYLDFAIFCNDGHFCIEVDGQQHYEKDHVISDNKRTNETNNQKWKTFRFNRDDLKTNFITATLEEIKKQISLLQGLDSEKGLLPTNVLGQKQENQQMLLFKEEHLDFLALRKRFLKRHGEV